MLLLVILAPMILGGCLFFLPFNQIEANRRKTVIGLLVLNAVFTGLVLVQPEGYVEFLQIAPDLAVGLNADMLAKLFLGLVCIVWSMVGIYSLDYIKHESHHERFYGFFFLSLGAMNGVCVSGNYMSFYLCFELLTLSSMPLVLHTQTSDSIQAAKKYLYYSVFGASLGLLGFFFINHFATTTQFVANGVLDPMLVSGNEMVLQIVCLITIIGFGAKAGMYPLHAWLPTAHPVAPAAASSLLSGVITKAGVLAIIRVIFYQFGVDFIRGTWVQTVLILLALFTVFMGSMLAYKERILKKRLAYSTVSQVSYILFGIFCLNPISMMGALLHVVAHSLIKDVLFMASGSIINQTHHTRSEHLGGMGKMMPMTFGLLTIASLGLIGIPPLIGFVSKWYLAQGALNGIASPLNWIGPVILLISALLTAGYLFSITIIAFFKPHLEEVEVHESSRMMVIPMAVLTMMIVLLGMFPTPLMRLIETILVGIF